MDKLILEVTEGVYSSAKAARAAGRIPIVYYAKGVKNRSFSVEYQLFRRTYAKGGRSTIMYLVNEKGEENPVLVHDIQYEPVTDDMIHIDVMAVDLNKPIRTKIPIMLIGTSAAVKDLGGILVQNRDSVLVECLPKDLIHEVQLDVSSIADFHTSLTIADIKLPATIKVLDAGNLSVATVSAPRSLLEEEELEAKAAAPVAPTTAQTPEEAAAAGAAAPAAGGKAPAGKEAAGKPAAAGKPEKKEEKKK
jgi:large subunit ribosomal protein L25